MSVDPHNLGSPADKVDKVLTIPELEGIMLRFKLQEKEATERQDVRIANVAHIGNCVIMAVIEWIREGKPRGGV